MNVFYKKLKDTFFSYKYWTLVQIIVSKTIEQEYGTSYLGKLWLLIRPFILILVLGVVLSRITRFPETENYIFFLTTNLVLWLFISSVMTSTSVSILSRAGILKLCPISKSIFIIVDIIKFSKIYLLSLIILYVIVGLITDVDFYITVLLFPIYFFILLIILLFIGVMLAYITPYVRDVRTLIEAFMPAFMWLTPIMYPISALDGTIGEVLKFSPFSVMMAPFTKILYYGEIPNLYDHIALLLLFFFTLILAVLSHTKLSKNVIYYT